MIAEVVHRLVWLYDVRNCPHPYHRRMCVHGDMIHHVGGKRAYCLDCRKFLPELPRICWRSQQPHPSVDPDADWR